MRNIYKTMTAGVMLAALAGCATTGDLDALRAEVDKANSTASQAAADASLPSVMPLQPRLPLSRLVTPPTRPTRSWTACSRSPCRSKLPRA